MNKILVDMTPIVEKLKRNLRPIAIGHIRTLKGTGKNEGKMRLVVTLSPERDLTIDIDVEEAFRNKKYFDSLTKDIYTLVEKSDARRFEKCRITG